MLERVSLVHVVGCYILDKFSSASLATSLDYFLATAESSLLSQLPNSITNTNLDKLSARTNVPISVPST